MGGQVEFKMKLSCRKSSVCQETTFHALAATKLMDGLLSVLPWVRSRCAVFVLAGGLMGSLMVTTQMSKRCHCLLWIGKGKSMARFEMGKRYLCLLRTVILPIHQLQESCKKCRRLSWASWNQ